MSKSYGNHIPLNITEEETAKILKTYYTDPEKLRKGDPGHPEKCPVYLLHQVYSQSPDEEYAAPCKTGALGCVDCKKQLTVNLNNALRPLRDRRVEIAEHPDTVWDVLEDSEGNIWIASNGGLSRMPGDFRAFGHYTDHALEGHPAILPEPGVNDVLADISWYFPESKKRDSIPEKDPE